MKTSKFLSLNTQDLLKGLVLSLIFFVLTSILKSLNAGEFPTTEQWVSIGKNGLALVISYLLKNFFTNSNDKFLKKETNTIQ